MREDFFLEMKHLYDKQRFPKFAQGDVYLLIKYLSFDPGVFAVVESANKFALVMPVQEVVAYLFGAIPKQGEAPFIKVPKKLRQEPDDKLAKKIMDIFCCGRRYADQVLFIYRQAGIDMGIQLGLK